MLFCNIYFFPKNYKIGSRKDIAKNFYNAGLDIGLKKSLTRGSILLGKIFYRKNPQKKIKRKTKNTRKNTRKRKIWVKPAINIELEYNWKDSNFTKSSKNFRSLSWTADKKFSVVIFNEITHRMTLFISKSFFVKKLDKLKIYINEHSRIGRYRVSVFDFNGTSDQLVETIYYDLDQIPDDLVKNKKGKIFFSDPELKGDFKIRWIQSLKKKYLNHLYSKNMKKFLFKPTKTNVRSIGLLRFLLNPFDIKFPYSCIIILFFLSIVMLDDIFIELVDRKKR